MGIWLERFTGTPKACARCKVVAMFDDFRDKTGKYYSSYCAPCNKVRMEEYAEKHPEKLKAIKKRWAEKNSSLATARAIKWMEDNPEKFKANMKAYKARNPLMRKADAVNRNRRVRAVADGTVTNAVTKVLYALELCHYCSNSTLLRDRTIDHKTPIARGGNHSVYNLVMACKHCNFRKAILTESEFIAKMQKEKEGALV